MPDDATARPIKHARCATCGAQVPSKAENPAFPFCSPRCKMVDLGRWLDGSYIASRPLGPDDADELERVLALETDTLH